mmetsp:Transcript_45165/g.74873  ORF Transcript_45165/g.74873 Transcript_45165/m.74873 type:complete len:134 (+) Transcript_45165:75-476(+)
MQKLRTSNIVDRAVLLLKIAAHLTIYITLCLLTLRPIDNLIGSIALPEGKYALVLLASLIILADLLVFEVFRRIMEYVDDFLKLSCCQTCWHLKCCSDASWTAEGRQYLVFVLFVITQQDSLLSLMRAANFFG